MVVRTSDAGGLGLARVESDDEDAGGAAGWTIANGYMLNPSSGWANTDTGFSFRITVTGTAVGGVSTDATLTDLVVNDGSADLTLTPTFVSDKYTYTAMVANTVDEVTVTPTKNDSGATIVWLDGSDMTLTDADTADGQQVTLVEGDNVIKVKVTAADGSDLPPIRVPQIMSLVDPVDLQPPEQVRIDLMPWVWLAGVGTPVDGLQAYQLHQPADPLAVDLVSVIAEPGSHPSGSVERCLQVLLVYEGHQLQVLGAGLGWQVVQRGAADTQQGALRTRDSFGSSRSIMARRWDRLTTRSSVTKNPVPP